MSLQLQKHRTVSAVIGAAYRGKVDPHKLNEQQWTNIVEFIRKPTEMAKNLGQEWPASKGRWDGPKGYRAQMEAAHAIVTKMTQMIGEPPANLEVVHPRARTFPPSWRDAAIRALYVPQRGGVECLGCSQLFRTRRELSLLHADHIVAWSQGGQTIWRNLQILCRPCNLAKQDDSWESFGGSSKRKSHLKKGFS